MRLHNKVAVITGAGAGLGQAVALQFATEGAHVFAVSIHEDELAEMTELARRAGRSIHAVVADVSSADDTKRVREVVIGTVGRIDALVNNAAIIFVKPLVETTVSEWDKLIATNLRGPFLYCKAFVPYMKKQQMGTIINVSSLAGIRGRAGETAYTASKFGVEGFSRALADELAPDHIRVLTVHPGVLIRTPMSMTTYDQDQRKHWRDPSVIAPAFVDLVARTDIADSGQRFDAWEMVQAQRPRHRKGPAEQLGQEIQEA